MKTSGLFGYLVFTEIMWVRINFKKKNLLLTQEITLHDQKPRNPKSRKYLK
jgi:hypothetical protein